MAIREFTGDLDDADGAGNVGMVREFDGDLDAPKAAWRFDDLMARQQEYDDTHSIGDKVGMGLTAGMESLRASKALGSAVDAAEDYVAFQEAGNGLSSAQPVGWRKPTKSAISARPGEPVDPLTGSPVVSFGGDPTSLGDEATAEAFKRKKERLESAIARNIKHTGKSASIPMSPVAEAAMKAETFGEAWDIAKQDPVAFIMDTGVRSAPFMVEPIVTGVVGASVGGVPGFMAATGLGSAHVDYAAELGEALQRQGVDTTNPEAVKAALLNNGVLSNIKSDARTHAAFVGLFDGLTAGLASKTLAPKAVSQPLAREFVNLVNQFGAQAAGGMAGEASGQYASTGAIHSPGEVLAEGAGEMITAPAEIITATTTGLRETQEAPSATDGSLGATDISADMQRGGQLQDSVNALLAEADRPASQGATAQPLDPFAERIAAQGAERQAQIDAEMPRETGPRFQVSPEMRAQTPQAQAVGAKTSPLVEVEPYDRRAARRDRAIYDNTKALGEVRLPEILSDPRLGRLSHRQKLKALANAKLPDANSQAINPETDELLEAIAKAGGLSLDEARAQGIDPAHFRDRQGVRNPFRRDGKSFDAMAETLAQYGYFGNETYTANGLLDKVSDSLGGTPNHSVAVNPDALALRESLNLVEGMSPQAAQQAIRKAIAGERLGVGQARAVSAALDAVTGERNEQAPHIRKQLDVARADRKAIRQGFAPLKAYEADDATAGEILDEAFYDPEWSASARMVGEWAVEALQADPQAALPVADAWDSKKITDREATQRLSRIIAEAKQHEQETWRQAASVPEDGQASQAEGRDAAAAPGAREVVSAKAAAEEVSADLPGAEAVTAPSQAAPAYSIEPFSDKSILIKGDKDAIRAKLAEAGINKGLWNAKHDGLVLPKKHESAAGKALFGDRRTSQEAAAEERRTGERRTNNAAREYYDSLTKEQLLDELLKHELTGIKGRRAFVREHGDAGNIISIDADSLKWINDNMSPEAGDRLLQEVANYLVDEFGFDYSYHISGDEFYVVDDGLLTEQELEEAMARVNNRLGQAIIKETKADGTVITKHGLVATHAIGKDRSSADAALKREKVAREQRGERAGRGEEPPGVSRQQAGIPEAAGPWEQAGGDIGATGPESGDRAADQGKSSPEVAAPQPISKADEEKASAILKSSGVSGKDRLDIMAKFRAGEYSLQDLEEAYPPGVDTQESAIKITEASIDTLKNWIDYPGVIGTINGWKLFHDKVVGRFVLMRKVKNKNEAGGGYVWAERAGDFETEESARAWARQSTPSKATKPSEVEAGEQQKIDDLGEKIGGARKDTAVSTGVRSPTSSASKVPAWRKRFSLVENTKTGKWAILDTRSGRTLRGLEFDTEAEAEAVIPIAAVGLKHNVRPVRNGIGFEIYRTVTDRKRIKVVNKVFPERDDAMRYMAEHAAEILETKTSFGEEILPTPDVVYRVGAERRSGNVNGNDFMDTFGFRGVEFGNWNNQAERQEVMNHAYDALLDLAEVMQVPPKALSLNGDLALAFGARGQGLHGAKAHYETDYGVINLTKMSGAGSLGHEWFHALDHYLGRQDGKASSERVPGNRGGTVFKSKGAKDMASHGFLYKSGVREELREAYKALIQTMFRKAEQYVEDTKRADEFVGRTRDSLKEELDRIRNDLAEEKDPRYWKRNNKPASAEQLAEFDALAAALVDGQNLETTITEVKDSRSSKNWRRSNDTLEAISAIMKKVRGRTGFTADGKGTLDYVRARMSNYAQRITMLEQAKTGDKKTKQVPTSFAMEAKEADQGRASDYWTTEHEMAARAFAAYLEDRIAEREGKSEFLTYHAHGAILAPTEKGYFYPYPQGEERIAINNAFDKLVEVLETRETDTGVALFAFAGEKSETADLGALGEAKRLAAKGQSAESIRLRTGWHMGVDGKWRYEISDDQASIKKPFPTKGQRWGDIYLSVGNSQPQSITVGQMLDHPLLYAAYPSVKDIVVVKKPGDGATYYQSANVIKIGEDEPMSRILSILLHEIQHAIQAQEGFARGGSADARFADSVKDGLRVLSRQSMDLVQSWKWQNSGTLAKAERTAEVARYGLMYESMKRLIDYAHHDQPTRVFRLIRNEMQWIYDEKFRGDETANELQRRFYAIPKRHRTAERRAFLADMAMDAANWLRGAIPADLRQQFQDDPRTMKGMLRALDREATKARKALEPLRDLEKQAKTARIVNKESTYKTSYDIYRALAGEIEARNTQARQAMTAEERRNTPPSRTADVSADEAIVIMGGMELSIPEIMASAAPQQDGIYVGTAETGLPVADVETITAKMALNWGGNARNIYVHQNVAGLPDRLARQVAPGDEGEVQGVHDPVTGDVHLIADNLPTKRDVHRILGHEMAGHTAMEEVVDQGGVIQGGWQAVERRIQNMVKAGNSQAKSLHEEVRSRGYNMSDRTTVTKEMLAIAVERHITSGPIGKLLQQIRAAIRNLLRKAGINSLLPGADIDAMVIASLRYLKGSDNQRTTYPNTLEHPQLGEIAVKVGKGRTGASKFVDAAPEVAAELEDLVAGAELTEETATRATLENGGTTFHIIKENGRWVLTDAANFARRQSGSGAFNLRNTLKHRADQLADLFDKFRYEAQDKHIYLKRMQEAIGNITEDTDAYGKEELYHGRVRYQIDKFHDDMIKPMLELIAMSGRSLEEVEEYLHARHAEEANAALRDINDPGRPGYDSLSGMTDAEAQRIKAQYSGDRIMRAIGLAADRIGDFQLAELERNGLESSAFVQAARAKYQHYVPLMREAAPFETSPAGPGKGSGYNVAKKFLRRRAGSTREVENIIPNLIAQAEATIINAEKAKVHRAIYDLAQQNPDPDFWELDTTKKRYTTDKNGRVSLTGSPFDKEAENALRVRIDGEDHVIRFNSKNESAMKMVAALRNMDQAQAGILVRMGLTINRYLSAVNTGFNPEFIISNAIRDIQTAVYNLSSTQADGIAKRMVKDWPKAFAGIRSALRGDGGHAWAQHFEEFREAGAMTGWLEHTQTIADFRKKLNRDISDLGDSRKAKAKRGIRKAVDLIEDYNMVVENAVRLSAFVNARDAGISTADAARMAKNLTVNFNRRGNKGVILNGMYLFYNASIQGSARLLQTVVTSKKGRALAAGTIAFAVMMDLLNRSMGGDDDDDVPWYDKIDEAVKERNLIIMDPFADDGSYYKFPLPWGYNVLHVIGQKTGKGLYAAANPDSATAKRTGIGDISDILVATAGAFNPIGGGTLAQTLAPTIMDPIVQLAENKNWMGNDLMPQDMFGQVTPESQKAWRSTPQAYKDVAEWLNEATGGNAARSGMIDWSPETLKMYSDTATGGLGRFVTGVVDTVQRATDSDLELDRSSIPMIRKLAGVQNRYVDQSLFYDRAAEVRTVKEELALFRGTPEISDIKADDRRKLIGMLAMTEKRLSVLRKQYQRALEKDDSAEIEAIDQRMWDAYKAFNQKYDLVVQ